MWLLLKPRKNDSENVVVDDSNEKKKKEQKKKKKKKKRKKSEVTTTPVAEKEGCTFRVAEQYGAKYQKQESITHQYLESQYQDSHEWNSKKHHPATDPLKRSSEMVPKTPRRSLRKRKKRKKM